MRKKQDRLGYLSVLRRDVAILLGIFALVLVVLWLARMIYFPGLAVGLVASASAALIYYKMRDMNWSANVPDIEAVDDYVEDGGKISLQSKLSIVEALTQPALMVVAGTIRGRNSAADDLFNLPVDRSGLSIASLRDPDLLSAIERVLSEGGHARCEIQPSRQQDEFWNVDITGLGANPSEDGVLLVLTDLKPLRLAERARADFLANASHELRTPLTSIGGFIETMKGPAKDDIESWPRFIDIMDEQTNHMRDLIGDLLSLSRIELSGHLMPETVLDLGSLSEQVVEALAHTVSQRGVSVAVKKPDQNLRIIGDTGEVKQVIGNLLGNAMKYAPDHSNIDIEIGASGSFAEAQAKAARHWEGADRVTLRLPQSDLGASVWLRVRDNGPGIEQKHLARLGERFFRVDGSRGGPIEGTGLGLAIVKHIMARHRGGFAVESVVGEGAAFSVWFAENRAEA